MSRRLEGKTAVITVPVIMVQVRQHEHPEVFARAGEKPPI